MRHGSNPRLIAVAGIVCALSSAILGDVEWPENFADMVAAGRPVPSCESFSFADTFDSCEAGMDESVGSSMDSRVVTSESSIGHNLDSTEPKGLILIIN